MIRIANKEIFYKYQLNQLTNQNDTKHVIELVFWSKLINLKRR